VFVAGDSTVQTYANGSIHQAGWGQMKELGQTNSVAVVDLGARAVTFLNGKADCDWASANFFLVRADGSVDGTHFQETGANILADLVVEGIRTLSLPLAAYAK
jgi:lysophospholipase L1-like esterase